MTNNHRYTTLLILLLAAIMAHAGPVERINNIKQDSLYIYGEATKVTTAEAYDAALNVLQANIQQWYEENNADKSARTMRNLTFLADTINAMRGDYHRVFAYVSIKDVEKTITRDTEQEEAARKVMRPTAIDSNSQLHDNPETDTMLHALIAKPLFRDFAALVTRYKQEGAVSSASRDITLQPVNSYLAIFNKTKKGEPLLYLLNPRLDGGNDLISGDSVNIELFLNNRNNYRFLWFVPSKPNKE